MKKKFFLLRRIYEVDELTTITNVFWKDLLVDAFLVSWEKTEMLGFREFFFWRKNRKVLKLKLEFVELRLKKFNDNLQTLENYNLKVFLHQNSRKIILYENYKFFLTSKFALLKDFRCTEQEEALISEIF